MGERLGIAIVDGIANVIKAPRWEREGGSERSERGAGVGIGILAERVSMVIKAPRREREGGSERSERGAGVGIGILAGAGEHGNYAPTGSGGGQRAVRPDRPERLSARGEDGRARAGGGVGNGLFVRSCCIT